MKLSRLLASGSFGLLVACGGDGGDNPGGLTCAAIGGSAPSSMTTAGCTGCAVDDDGLASDGNFGSSAILSVPAAANGSVSVRATAGNTFAAGTPAGAIWSASSSNQTNPTWTIRTYLNGVLRETGAVSSDGVGSPERPVRKNSISTTLPFDAIEFDFTRSAGTSGEITRVYEFCVN